jgi:hypothetical protein
LALCASVAADTTGSVREGSIVSVLLLIAFAAVTAGAGYALFAGELLLCIALLSLSGVLGLTLRSACPASPEKTESREKRALQLAL